MRVVLASGFVWLTFGGQVLAQPAPISRAQVQIERSFYLKQAADEIYIRAKAPPGETVGPLSCDGSPDWLKGACRAIAREGAADAAKVWRRAAMIKYVEAAVQLSRASGKANAGLAERFSLLQKDIAYRARLLQLNQDFWGSTTFGEPGIPAIQLLEMKESLAKLEGLAAEINALQDRSEDKAFQQLQTAASAAGSSGDVQATLPNSEKLDHAKREAQQRIASANEQLQLSIVRQQEVEAQQGRLKSQAEQISNSFAQKLASAAGSYLGVPEDVTKFANGKPLQDNLRDALAAHAGDVFSDPELLSSFGELGQTAASFNKKVQDIKAQYADKLKSVQDARQYLKQAQDVAEDIKAGLRSPSAENLIRIGERTLARVDPAAAAKLKQNACSLLDQSKPVRALIEQGRNPSAIGDRIRAEIANQIPDLSGAKLAIELRLFTSKLALPQKAAWINSISRRVSQLPDVVADANQKVQGEIARAVLRFWPRSVVALLPPAKRSELFDALRKQYKQAGLLTEAELLEKLRSETSFRLDVSSGVAVLTVGAQSFRLGSFESVLQAGELADGIQVAADKIDSELEGVIDRLQNSADIVRAELLKALPFDSIEKGAAKVAQDASAAARLWDRTIGAVDKGVSCTAPGGVASRVADMQVGSLMTTKIQQARRSELEYPPNSNGEQIPAPPASAGSPDSPDTELVKQGISAAFPGYGTAVSLAIDFIKGFQQVSGLAKQIEDLTAEATRLTQHDIELRATIDASNMALELGVLESELGQIRRDTAKQQFALLTRATQAAGAQQQRGLQRIENRLPQFFYLAEQLREKYDELDRSIALWGPSGGTVRDVIKQLIIDNPKNIRLALDNDIQLFAWTDRDDERNRTDIDRVLAHWRQLYQLASDVCSRIGCIPGRSQIGHVQQSDLLDVCVLVNTRQCSELQRWLDHPIGTFNADLTVPLDGLVPDYAINARVIDVRIGGFNANREPVRLRNALLSHPGVSFVRMEDSIVRETFRPAQTSSLEWPATWDLDAVAGRWNTAAQPRRLPFEGYGLQTAWQLTLRPWTGSVALDRKTAVKDATYDPGRQSGLFIRFVYNHQIRTKENVFATEQRSSNCRVVLSLSGPARLDFAPIIVSPAMAALASTQIAPVGLPLRPGSDGTCPRLPTELSSHSFAGNLRATPASAAERETRIKQESLDLLASCVGKPRRGVRFERVAGMWFGSQYEDLANSLRKGIDGANTREDVCNKLRQGVGSAWWTK